MHQFEVTVRSQVHGMWTVQTYRIEARDSASAICQAQRVADLCDERHLLRGSWNARQLDINHGV